MKRMISNKVDFIATIEVNNSNPNGDPLAGNMPRTDSKGYGEISDVCLKRKVRNRMQDQGCEIFVQARDRTEDGKSSLQERFEDYFKEQDIKIEPANEVTIERLMNERWLDVRSFGQVVAFTKKFSLGIRGPVSISIAKSLDPIEINTMQITRSTNGVKPKGNSSRSSDTMGTKHSVEFGVYILFGSVNVNFSERTGFSQDDLSILKESIRSLFVNDVSSARPDGSMEMKDIFWFTHKSKIGDVSSAKVKDLLVWNQDDSLKETYDDYNIHLDEEKLTEYQEKGLQVEHFEGL